MQTFLPYSDYRLSAQALDQKRLGKQRVETLQILQVLLGERLITSDKKLNPDGSVTKVPRPKAKWTREPLTAKGWRNHPAVLMWKGHELELLNYQRAICDEWTSRGYRDSCLEKSEFLVEPHRAKLSREIPQWLGREKFHLSHRSNLKRKDEGFYGALWPKVASNLPYEWPATSESE